MKFWHESIDCPKLYKNSCRLNPFTVIGYEFNYSVKEDQILIDKLLEDADKLSNNVYSGAANDSDRLRSHNRVYANCIAGVISEYCWKHFLNYKSEIVQSTPFESAKNQIDLEIISNKKKIEVRSSFPRNGLGFAICHPYNEFDIIGPYSNAYKPGEILKDYFVRTLFPMKSPINIIDGVKSNSFTLYLTGGATKKMMFNDNISKEKSFIPEDNFFTQSETNYRVVPFHDALDSAMIYQLITHE